MRNRRGQTILEYTVVMIIILGVLIAMKDYIKRGFQGRWKSATDGFGDQYDPTAVNSNVTYATAGNSTSTVTVSNGTDAAGDMGQWTTRGDTASTVESKTASTQVGN
jgi:hypothetical protein